MNKELPEMYRCKFEKEIKNNESIYSSLVRDNDISNSHEVRRGNITNNDRFTIEQKIFNIFNARDYIYKADVTIITDNNILKKRIVGKNNSNLITMDNEYIPISIIRDIYKN